jgi:hypothetical protein
VWLRIGRQQPPQPHDLQAAAVKVKIQSSL